MASHDDVVVVELTEAEIERRKARLREGSEA